jgi:hypothetical protein
MIDSGFIFTKKLEISLSNIGTSHQKTFSTFDLIPL